jgi:hypothetical protein
MAKSSAANPPLVEVVWGDAWGEADDEVSLDDVASTHTPTIMHTVGWLVHQDEIGVSIFNEKYDSRPSYRGRTFILASMIKSITPLPGQRKRRSPKRAPIESTTKSESPT